MAKKKTKISLSGHVLSVNTRSYDRDLFDFEEFDPYVRALTGSREYQYQAIKDLLIYLWGGRYKTILDLAKENYDKPEKEALRQRFQSKDHFLASIPLPDRLSGVCHMATGTGKSYVMIAVAYISLLLDKVDRVLVLGPSSTVIEQGLTEKFSDYLYGEAAHKLNSYLPDRYRRTVIKLLNANDPIEDQSIVIENINAVYNEERNSLGDTLFTKGSRVLVLSDEVHHAYSHLKFVGDRIGYDFDPEKIDSSMRNTSEGQERLWMKYLRDKPIAWHLGFTGTPYNEEFFSDVIVNYSIKDAENQYIKHINAVIHVNDGVELNQRDRFNQIIATHIENKRKYSYPENNIPRLKPITIFISQRTQDAKNVAQEFAQVLAEYYGKHITEYEGKGRAELEALANDKIIVVTSDTNKSEYKAQLDQIEEIDPSKVGGNVEFISAVNKLSEGWDVDNVFQIVPAQERVFNSKLLISQVIGRGLRLPRKISFNHIVQNYPTVTITNHEKFGPYVKELYDEVTECELRLHVRPLENPQVRADHHFSLFNTTYTPINKITEIEMEKSHPRTLQLEPQPQSFKVSMEYLKDTKTFVFDKEFMTIGQVVNDVARKFKNVAYERENFDFDDGLNIENLPTRTSIEDEVRHAIKRAGISGERVSIENAKKIMLHFNQLLGKSKKKVERENVGHSIYGISTKNIPISTVNSGRVGEEISVFLTEDYKAEIMSDDLFTLEYIEKEAESSEKSARSGQMALLNQEIKAVDIRPLIQSRNVVLVNTPSFKTPLSLIATSHSPEREFVIKLVEHSKYVSGWIKSPDMGFYSVEYDYWKKGKDKVRMSFNPDFFINISIKKYLSFITNDLAKAKIRELEEQYAVDTIILVVEIKGENDESDITKAKDEAGQMHFEDLNKRLANQTNRANLPEEFRKEVFQSYRFKLVRQEEINLWFSKLKDGSLIL